MGSFSGLGTNIPHAARGGQKKTHKPPKLWDSWDSESFWVGEQVEVPGGGAPGEDIEALCPSPILCPTLLSGCS